MIDFVLFFNRCLFLTLVHSIWQFAVLAMIAWSIGRLVRRNVELSYAVNVAALMLGLVAVPVTFCLISYAGPPAENLGFENSQAVASKALAGSTILPYQNADRDLGVAGSGNASTSTLPTNASILVVFELLSPWITGIYFAGVALMFTRLSGAIHRAGLIKTHAQPISIDGHTDLLQSLANTWSMKIVPKIALAEQIVVPKVVGLLRPTILLPASAITGLSRDDLEMVLAHELAHVQRHDTWVNLIQRVAESVMFFNPAVWFVSRRIDLLREYCCDEMACESLEAKIDEPTDQPRTRYALALLRIVELAQNSINHASSPKIDLTSLAVSGRSPSELRRRVARLFGEPLRESIRLSRCSFLFGAIAFFLLVGPAVWQSRAESSTHLELLSAMDALSRLTAIEIQNNSSEFNDVSGQPRVDSDDVIKAIEISSAPGLAGLTDLIKPLEREPMLRGLDEGTLNLKMISASEDYGLSADTGQFKPVAPPQSVPVIALSDTRNHQNQNNVERGIMRRAVETSRSPSQIGVIRSHEKGGDTGVNDVSSRILLFGSKLKRGFQYLLGRQYVRKHTQGGPNSISLSRRPLLLNKRK